MPILMVALIALAAFGLIGAMLALAVTLEQKKANGKPPGAGKAGACDLTIKSEVTALP